MEARLNLFENPVLAKVFRHVNTAAKAVADSTLPDSTAELVKIRASQINGCGFCVDIHIKEAAAAGETPDRTGLVAAWRHSTVFSEAERAALALAEEGTRLADAHQGVSDETWALVRKHYDDDQTVALVALIAMINASNRFAVMLNNLGGSYRPGMFDGIAD